MTTPQRTWPKARPTRRGVLAAGLAGLTTLVTCGTATAQSKALVGPVPAPDVQVMTYNLRYDSKAPASSPDHWPRRAAILSEFLRREQPALLGTQEGLAHQLPVVAAALPGHRMAGEGREGGDKGEYSAIFYDGRRFTLLEQRQFWLSDTPDVVGSTSWGNTLPRIVVKVRLRDKATGRELVMMNTHFDHASENARLRSAQLIRREAETAGELPVLVTGDFNASALSPVHDSLTGAGTLRDLWLTTGERLTPAWGTFPDYREPVCGGAMIDWLLGSAAVESLRAGINPHRDGGHYASDHLPVQAVVRLS